MIDCLDPDIGIAHIAFAFLLKGPEFTVPTDYEVSSTAMIAIPTASHQTDITHHTPGHAGCGRPVHFVSFPKYVEMNRT